MHELEFFFFFFFFLFYFYKTCEKSGGIRANCQVGQGANVSERV